MSSLCPMQISRMSPHQWGRLFQKCMKNGKHFESRSAKSSEILKHQFFQFWFNVGMTTVVVVCGSFPGQLGTYFRVREEDEGCRHCRDAASIPSQDP